eukprot:GILJ01007898.1.p1 GENE.GILJ01007898.1~~GILJ01007898.1.p1  ORF type:complete len:997 (-),score=144.94 GILJ01007898.1:177-2813(-)
MVLRDPMLKQVSVPGGWFVVFTSGGPFVWAAEITMPGTPQNSTPTVRCNRFTMMGVNSKLLRVVDVCFAEGRYVTDYQERVLLNLLIEETGAAVDGLVMIHARSMSIDWSTGTLLPGPWSIMNLSPESSHLLAHSKSVCALTPTAIQIFDDNGHVTQVKQEIGSLVSWVILDSSRLLYLLSTFDGLFWTLTFGNGSVRLQKVQARTELFPARQLLHCPITSDSSRHATVVAVSIHGGLQSIQLHLQDGVASSTVMSPYEFSANLSSIAVSDLLSRGIADIVAVESRSHISSIQIAARMQTLRRSKHIVTVPSHVYSVGAHLLISYVHSDVNVLLDISSRNWQRSAQSALLSGHCILFQALAANVVIQITTKVVSLFERSTVTWRNISKWQPDDPFLVIRHARITASGKTVLIVSDHSISILAIDSNQQLRCAKILHMSQPVSAVETVSDGLLAVAFWGSSHVSMLNIKTLEDCYTTLSALDSVRNMASLGSWLILGSGSGGVEWLNLSTGSGAAKQPTDNRFTLTVGTQEVQFAKSNDHVICLSQPLLLFTCPDNQINCCRIFSDAPPVALTFQHEADPGIDLVLYGIDKQGHCNVYTLTPSESLCKQTVAVSCNVHAISVDNDTGHLYVAVTDRFGESSIRIFAASSLEQHGTYPLPRGWIVSALLAHPSTNSLLVGSFQLTQETLVVLDRYSLSNGSKISSQPLQSVCSRLHALNDNLVIAASGTSLLLFHAENGFNGLQNARKTLSHVVQSISSYITVIAVTDIVGKVSFFHWDPVEHSVKVCLEQWGEPTVMYLSVMMLSESAVLLSTVNSVEYFAIVRGEHEFILEPLRTVSLPACSPQLFQVPLRIRDVLDKRLHVTAVARDGRCFDISCDS